MKLSIIIVNYNVRYYLEQAVKAALKAMEGLNAELIVVDNASVDGSSEMMRDKFPQVNYIFLNENTGFSKGNNIGMKASQGEYILLLNPDTVVAENAFSEAVSHMDKHPDIGGLGVHMIDGSGRFLPESKRGLPTPRAAFYKVFGLSSLFPKSRRFGSYHLSHLNKEETNDVEILSGAFMMMRREALDKAGLLDEAFFMYGEDIDLSYRLIKAGYRNVYYPHSRIIHYKGESTKKGSVNYVFVFYRAMVIFAKKHFDRGQASLFGALINIAIYFRAFLAIFRRLFGRIWKAILDGLIAYTIFLSTTTWYANFAGKNFDLPFVSIALIGYAVLIAVVLLYANVYDKGAKPKDLIKGWAFAFLILLGIYALLPEHLRFSRAVIVIGSTLSLIGGFAWRYLEQLIAKLREGITLHDAAERILIVGDQNSLATISSFLSAHALDPSFSTGVLMEACSVYPVGYACSEKDLVKAIEDFRIDQVIFDQNAMRNEQMIELMERCKDKHVSMIIATGSPLYLIGGSQVIAEQQLLKVGDLLTIKIQAVKRLKRTLDLLIAPLLILLSPIMIFMVDQKAGFLHNLISLIRGTKTLVGLDPRGRHALLPSLPDGILHDQINVIIPEQAHATVVKANFNYLKEYHPLSDLMLILRNIHMLGG